MSKLVLKLAGAGYLVKYLKDRARNLNTVTAINYLDRQGLYQQISDEAEYASKLKGAPLTESEFEDAVVAKVLKKHLQKIEVALEAASVISNRTIQASRLGSMLQNSQINQK